MQGWLIVPQGTIFFVLKDLSERFALKGSDAVMETNDIRLPGYFNCQR